MLRFRNDLGGDSLRRREPAGDRSERLREPGLSRRLRESVELSRLRYGPRGGSSLEAERRRLESRVPLEGDRLLDRERFVDIVETEPDECDEMERLRFGAEDPLVSSLLRFRLLESSRADSTFLT